jgi:hypothetical protein
VARLEPCCCFSVVVGGCVERPLEAVGEQREGVREGCRERLSVRPADQ